MYQYSDRVSYSEVDAQLNLTYYGLVNYMQDCSCFHSDDVGVGVNYLAPRDRGWFVTNYEIHINRRPKYLEHITIKTYPYQVRGMMARRLYVIETLDGEVLMYADSLWVLMDLKNNRHELCQVKRNGQWYEINDTMVKKINSTSYFDRSYGLFYKKKN